MNWTNYHMHSHYCDGEGDLESYIIEATKKKMYAIGFSGHAPVPFYTDWHMQLDHLDSYISEIKFLKEKHKEMNIYSGLEVDYIPGQIGPQTYANRDLDFIIGSVHYAGQFKNRDNCCIDGTIEEFERALKLVFNNDIEQLVTRYYENVIEMIEHDPPDIIGHLDLIKKLNSNDRYFSEDAGWYKNLIVDVVKVISASDSILEVNTRGYYKSNTKEFYPSKQILEKCFESDIPVTISSDAHHPNELDQSFEEAASVLLDIGYNHIYIFDKGRWSTVQISRDGSGLRVIHKASDNI